MTLCLFFHNNKGFFSSNVLNMLMLTVPSLYAGNAVSYCELYETQIYIMEPKFWVKIVKQLDFFLKFS